MRAHFHDEVRDQQGNAVAGASVSVYQAGTETAVTCYSAKSGGTTYTTAPQIATGTDGSFDFYVDDTDYDHDQEFKLKITKTGFTTKEIDYIPIFPNLTGHLMSKDGNGDKWYMKPRPEDGGLEGSKTKGEIVV